MAGAAAGRAVEAGAAALDGAGDPVAGAAKLIRPGCAVTLIPGRARWVPSITTRSVRDRPERITRRAPRCGPVCTGLAETMPSRPTTKTICRAASAITALSGSSSAG